MRVAGRGASIAAEDTRPALAPIGPEGLTWRQRWDGLAPNVRGAIWVVLSCLCVASMAALVKLAGTRLDSFQLVFLRASFGLLIVLPFALRAGPGVLRSARPGLHLSRGLAGSIAMMCGFFALTRLPLADVTAIGFTAPMFLVVLAALVLGETVRARRWSATVVGFLDVLIMLRPGDGVLELAALAALLGAFAVATVKLLVKQLARTEQPLTIILYLGVVSTVVTALPAAVVWQPPGPFELAMMLAAAALASLAQVCFIRGYRIGEASALAPFEYARLPFAAAYGFWLFAEVPDRYTLLGAALIVASSLYIGRREAQLGRRPAPRPAVEV
jgi:drug/metabolite transporter (DMT)-like permease